MSVIYQSLTKLRSSAHAQQGLRQIALDSRGKLVRRSRVFTPGMLLLAALVFLCGIGASFGIYRIQYESVDSQAVNGTPRVTPPSFSSTEKVSATNADNAGGRSFAPHTDEPHKKDNRFRNASAGKARSSRQPAVAENVMAETTTTDPPAATASSASGTVMADIGQEMNRRPVERPRRSRDSTQSAAADIEHIRRTNMRRSLDISRLISEIQQSMRASDERRTERLLEQLTTRKGRHDPYVMKLKSYWYTQRGDLNRAAALLHEVLQRKPNDLEAGINMAILEIKTGRIRQADERLCRLRETYPEDTRIPEMIDKLRP